MEFKKQIEEVLETLKAAGFDRGRIEEDMGYSPNYIDQTLSKGGNKKFLKAMTIYRLAMLQNATPTAGDSHVSQKLLEQVEARRRDFEKWAELARSDKERADKEKDRLLNVIDGNMALLIKVVGEINSNSKSMGDDISALTTEVQAEHKAMMDTLDKVAKQPIGTTAAAADTVELASHAERAKRGKAGVGK